VRKDVVFLIREFIAIVESFFRGQILIGLIMGVLLGPASRLSGWNLASRSGSCSACSTSCPISAPSWVSRSPCRSRCSRPGGGWSLFGLVLLVKVIVQTIESWMLTPKIMGDRTGLHPVAIIVAIFFWGTAFGRRARHAAGDSAHRVSS